MANLSDDLILEIILRLPLKYAVQCSLLNKNFFRWISHPSFVQRTAVFSLSRSSNSTILFHCSTHNPKIFTSIAPKSPQASRILRTEISILASCNGVLLFRLKSFRKYYVFNPTTGGIMSLDYPINGDDVGLAVDLDGRNYHFKLVTIDVINPGSMYRTVLRFDVVVPSATAVGPSMLLKSWTDFVCQSFALMPDENIQSVYAHGCLHWIRKDGEKIAVFDVEMEQARIINGPIAKDNGHGFHAGVDKWFGFADGSIRFVYSLQEEIVIHSHDYLKDEWRVTHKIGNVCNPSNNDCGNGVPLLFDGRRLFIQLRRKGEDGEVRVHDILSEKWEKFGKVEGWSDRKQLFFSYFPTLAKVSDKYLLRKNNTRRWKCRKAVIKNSFRGLQRLLRYPN